MIAAGWEFSTLRNGGFLRVSVRQRELKESWSTQKISHLKITSRQEFQGITWNVKLDRTCVTDDWTPPPQTSFVVCILLRGKESKFPVSARQLQAPGGHQELTNGESCIWHERLSCHSWSDEWKPFLVWKNVTVKIGFRPQRVQQEFVHC